MDPRQQSAPVQRQPAASPVAAVTNAGSSNGLLQKILMVALSLAALSLIAYFASRALKSVSADAPIKSKQYQAVFLTNGQVYFGKVASIDSSYVKLNDIYYLQVASSTSTQTVQPKDATAAANQQVSLAKLGGELHGPEDVMYVNRDQVLFWENLKTDGKVAKAIADYKSTNK